MSHAVYVHDIAHVIVDNLQFMMGTDSNISDRWRVYIFPSALFAENFHTTRMCNHHWCVCVCVCGVCVYLCVCVAAVTMLTATPLMDRVGPRAGPMPVAGPKPVLSIGGLAVMPVLDTPPPPPQKRGWVPGLDLTVHCLPGSVVVLQCQPRGIAFFLDVPYRLVYKTHPKIWSYFLVPRFI